MNDSFSTDPNFAKMIKYVINKSTDTGELIQAIQSFRNSLNLRYVSQFLKPHLNCSLIMKDVWDILFTLVEHPDSNVRMSVYNTMGAIIFFLGPFISVYIVNSFLKAIQNLQPSQYTSLAVISCYCHLTPYISLLHENEFYSSLPIIQHFSFYAPENHKYFLTLFSILTPNNEFCFSVYNTLLQSFGKDPTPELVKSLYELLKHSPEILSQDYYLFSKPEFSKLLLMISPQILQNDVLFKILTEKQINYLIEISSLSLLRDDIQFIEFEQSCLIIAIFQSKNIKIPGIEKIFEKSLPEHLKIFTFKLTTNFNDLIPIENDSLSTINSKIDAISFYLQKNPENFKDLIKGFDIFIDYLDKSSETFTHCVDSLIPFYSEMKSEIFDNKDINLRYFKALDIILTTKTKNWVQQNKVVSFLSKIPNNFGEKLIKGFEKRRIYYLMEATLNKQKNLSKSAVEILSNVISSKNLIDVIDFIIHSDIINAHELHCCLNVVNKLSEKFGISKFVCLEPIFTESFLMNPSISVSASYFKFFSEIGKFDSSIFSRSKDLLAKLLKSYIGTDLGLDQENLSYDLPPLNTLLNTDILSHKLGEENLYFECLRESLTLVTRASNYDTSLLQPCLILTRLFPTICFEYFMKYPKTTEELKAKIKDILTTANTISLAAKAAAAAKKFELNDENTKNCIDQYLQNYEIHDARDLYNFYLYVDKDIISYLSKLDQKNTCLFEFLSDSKLSGADFTDKIYYVKNFDFQDWPVEDKEFYNYIQQNIQTLIDSKTPIIINKQLDDCHLRFIGEFPELFKQISVDEKFSYQRTFKGVSTEDLAMESSITPSIIQNEIIDDVSLLKSFCLYSDLKVEDDIYNAISQLLVKYNLYNLLFEYSVKFSREIPKEILSEIDLTCLDDDTLINLGNYYYNLPKKPQILKDFYKSLAVKYSNPLLHMKRNKTARAVVNFNPQRALDSFIANFKPTTKNVKSLIFFDQLYGHSIDKEYSVIDKLTTYEYDDEEDFKLVLYVLRYFRSFVSFSQSLLNSIESSLLNAKNAAQLNEVRGIISYFPAKQYLQGFASNYKNLNNLFVEGYSKIESATYDMIKWNLYLQIPSQIISVLRSLKSISNNYVFGQTYWATIQLIQNFVPRNIILLQEYAKFLLYLESSDNPPKVYGQYIKPAAITFRNNLKLETEKELFHLFDDPKQNIQDSSDKPALMKANNYFMKGISLPPHTNLSEELLTEMGTMGAAYFVIGLANNLNSHFFDLYIVLATIIRRMTREESVAFRNISKSQILPGMTNKQRQHSIELLLEGKRKSRLAGAAEAASIDSIK